MQRTTIVLSFSAWYDIMPPASILGPLLFNIFINDFFLFIKRSHVCNFVDYNTLYSCNKNLSEIFEIYCLILKKFLNWFRINSLKANPTNTSRVFHVETMWKRSFPRHFNVEYTWSVCRVTVKKFHLWFSEEVYLVRMF